MSDPFTPSTGTGPALTALIASVAVLYGTAVMLVLYVQEQGSNQQAQVQHNTGQNTHFTHQDHELRCRSKYNPNWGPCWRL